VPELFREAFRTALSPRQGPVQLNLPRDVLAAQADFPAMQAPMRYRNQSVPAAQADDVKTAAKMLSGATRPVIVAGGGIKNTRGHDAAIALAEALNCPIVTSPGHGDAISFGHRLNAGQMGPRGNAVASRLVKEADVILALGTRLGFNATFYTYDNINRDAQIIQVELEPTAIGRFFPVAMGIWADAPTCALQLADVVNQIADRAKADAWTADFQAERQTFLAQRDADAIRRIQPSHRACSRPCAMCCPTMRRSRWMRAHLCLQATDALNYWTPGSLFTPLDFGLVGFSFACGMGVKCAQTGSRQLSA